MSIDKHIEHRIVPSEISKEEKEKGVIGKAAFENIYYGERYRCLNYLAGILEGVSSEQLHNADKFFNAALTKFIEVLEMKIGRTLDRVQKENRRALRATDELTQDNDQYSFRQAITKEMALWKLELQDICKRDVMNFKSILEKEKEKENDNS